MGVEWRLGCLKCKKYIWLGSQKPFSWKGFQIGDENVKRFLSIHSLCNKNANGNLLITNDGTTKTPWEDENKRLEWKEDILSRKFCFDSYCQKGIKCANCFKSLELEEENRRLKGNIMKSEYLWYCNNACFESYIEYNQKENGNFIHDSTNDLSINLNKYSVEVGCTICRTYVIIDNKKNIFDKIKNFEYLALFFNEHIGHEHLLKLYNDKKETPWNESINPNKWKEFEY